jgi:hypothetical protein
VAPEHDIWLAAALAIRHYGENAEAEAARRADLMLKRGDCDGQSLWLQIRRAIAELQAAPSGPVN